MDGSLFRTALNNSEVSSLGKKVGDASLTDFGHIEVVNFVDVYYKGHLLRVTPELVNYEYKEFLIELQGNGNSRFVVLVNPFK